LSGTLKLSDPVPDPSYWKKSHLYRASVALEFKLTNLCIVPLLLVSDANVRILPCVGLAKKLSEERSVIS
jgi:hypothetical protein